VALVVDGACGCEAGSRGVGPVAHGGSVGGAWVAHGWRRWPFEEEGLCGQIMASGLEKRKKKKDILVILWLSTREVVLTSGL